MLPLKQVIGWFAWMAQPEFESSSMKPWPTTTNEVGSITFVEPPGWMTRTFGVVLSVTSTSCGATSVELRVPATHAYWTALAAVAPARFSVSVQVSPNGTVPVGLTASTSFAQDVVLGEPDTETLLAVDEPAAR